MQKYKINFFINLIIIFKHYHEKESTESVFDSTDVCC
jgi:hypothetical protein